MDVNSFEGSKILEKLAEINRLDDFFEAIDSDNFSKIKSLLKQAQIDTQTASLVLKKIIDSSDEH